MTKTSRLSGSRRIGSLLALVAVASLGIAACGSSSSSSSDTAAPAVADTTAPVADAATGANLQAPGQCGMGTGTPATGEPIKLGGLATNVPGIDFTWITTMTGAYFKCVNDNGGINGRPIEYTAVDEQLDPTQIASIATKLIEEDKVLGLVGNTSIIDCSVNGAYYAEKGFYPIIAGVDQACFTSANFSAVNMGPYYSSLGGAQAALRAGAKGTMVIVSPNLPGYDLIDTGVTDFAKANGLKAIDVLEDVPFADPASLAQRLVKQAGPGGAVVLDFTGPVVLPLLQAIEQQGLIDSVIWASSTPPNDPSVSKELSAKWNGKFLVNAEMNVLDSGLPDQNHMEVIRAKYAPDLPSAAFTQFGYLAGRIATDALMSIKGDLTQESVNAAFKGIKNWKTDMFCKPWYYSSGAAGNVSNNSDITVAPKDGVWVKVEDCFDIAALPNNPLDAIRANEIANGLNVG